MGEFRRFVSATKYTTEAEKNASRRVWSVEKGGWERKPEDVWSNPDLGGDCHPVRFVSLADARTFCEWLSQKEGCRYAVPTDEQWGYACRAGTTTRWSFGDDPNRMKDHGLTVSHTNGQIRPTGGLAPNPFGLYDMHGNVGEMTVNGQGQMVERGGNAGDSVWRAPRVAGAARPARGHTEFRPRLPRRGRR